MLENRFSFAQSQADALSPMRRLLGGAKRGSDRLLLAGEDLFRRLLEAALAHRDRPSARSRRLYQFMNAEIDRLTVR